MKKLTALLLTGALAVSALTGCGSSSSDKAADTTDKTEEATDAAEDTADTAKAADGELTTIKVAASQPGCRERRFRCQLLPAHSLP